MKCLTYLLVSASFILLTEGSQAMNVHESYGDDGGNSRVGYPKSNTSSIKAEGPSEHPQRSVQNNNNDDKGKEEAVNLEDNKDISTSVKREALKENDETIPHQINAVSEWDKLSIEGQDNSSLTTEPPAPGNAGKRTQPQSAVEKKSNPSANDEEDENISYDSSPSALRLEPVSSYKSEIKGPIKKPHNDLDEEALDKESKKKLLNTSGVEPNEDNLAARFQNRAELSDRLRDNIHGPFFILKQATFETHSSLKIFEGLCETSSVRVLDFEGCTFEHPSFLTLSQMLCRNRSLKTLVLSNTTLPKHALRCLGLGLVGHGSLREINLQTQSKNSFNPKEIERFYELLKENKGLRLIIWPKDNAEVLKEFRKLSDKNYVAALHRGIMFRNGIIETQDSRKELAYLEKANKLGNPLAAYEIGKYYERVKDIPQALAWYEKGKQKDDARAYLRAGEYHRGIWPKGSDIDQLESAFADFKKAADLGHRRALYRLGRMYEAGRFIERDLNQAAELFFKAGEKGYADAFVALVMLYNNPEYAEHCQTTSQFYNNWATRFKRTNDKAERIFTDQLFWEKGK